MAKSHAKYRESALRPFRHSAFVILSAFVIRPSSFGIHLLSLLAVTLSASISAADQPTGQRRPNIVVFLADDLGYADLSMHGSKDIQTPHIDALARNGVRMTSGYVSAPYCSPTRAGLLTGRYQQRFGYEFNPILRSAGGRDGLPIDQRTIADFLRQAGYVSALIGKWHLGEEPSHHPLNRGFDEFFGFVTGAHSYLKSEDTTYGDIQRGKQKAKLDGYLTDVLAQEANQFIERNKDRPFFLYLAFNAVHTPMEAPDAAVKEFANVPDKQRRTYLAMTRKLDDAIGQVMAKLRELNLEEDTLVFFLSDNGGPTTKFSSNGSRNFPLRGSKGDTWEGGIRVPFVIQWKGRLPAGKTFDHPVISLDILPTALAAARHMPKDAPPFDGVNLLPFLTGVSTKAPHDSLYWRFGRQTAIRQGDWVLVRPSMGTKEYEDIAQTPLLFNLAKDIGQTRDLAKDFPDRVRAMEDDWNRWDATLTAPRWPATLRGKIFDLP